MWTCKSCGANVDDDTWTDCWKCTVNKDATPAELKATQERRDRSMSCLRCKGTMEYAGTRRFRDESILKGGLFGALFGEREDYDVYFCADCGKVELYIDGIGDEGRGERTH